MSKSSFEEEIQRKGYLLYRVEGDSMMPLIRQDKDLVLISGKPEGRLKKYDVPLYKRDSGQYVLHRIVRICGTEVILMGDGNFRETESCRLSDIMGIVTKIIRNGRYVDCNTRAERYKAEIWSALLPIRRYLLYIYRRIWI